MPNSTQINPQLVTKAIAYTENGGKPNLSNPSAGKSGEMKSIFQYTPETWAADSKEILGESGVPLNNDTEAYVTTQMVSKWLKEGKTLPQIFSSWNAGQGEPDAYTGKFSDGSPSVGRNKEGVSFNVPAYVKTAMNYYDQFSQGGASSPAPLATNASPENTPPQEQPPNQAPQVTPEQYKSAVNNIVSLVQGHQKKGAQPSGILPQVPTSSPGMLNPSAPSSA